MIHSFFFVVALLAPNESVLIVPENSPFTIQEAGLENGGSTRFNGELRLEGNYQFEWRVRDEAPEWLELRIIPNEASLKLIPFAQDKPVVELWVRNPEVVARDILSRSDVERLFKQEILEESGWAVFRVGALETAVNCDSRSYVVDVLEAKAGQLQVKTNVVFAPRVGC